MCFTPPELKEPARAHVASCGAKLLGLTVSVKVRFQLCEAVSRSPAFESVGAERLIKRHEAHGLRECAPDARLFSSRSLEEIRAQLMNLSQTRSIELIKEKRRQLAQERRQMLLHMLALDDMIAASQSRSRSSKRGSTSIDSSVPKGRRSKTLPPTASGVRIRFRGRARPSVFCSQRMRPERTATWKSAISVECFERRPKNGASLSPRSFTSQRSSAARLPTTTSMRASAHRRGIKLLDDIFVVDLMAYSRSGSRSGFLLQYAVRVDESAGS